MFNFFVPYWDSIFDPFPGKRVNLRMKCYLESENDPYQRGVNRYVNYVRCYAGGRTITYVELFHTKYRLFLLTKVLQSYFSNVLKSFSPFDIKKYYFLQSLDQKSRRTRPSVSLLMVRSAGWFLWTRANSQCQRFFLYLTVKHGEAVEVKRQEFCHIPAENVLRSGNKRLFPPGCFKNQTATLSFNNMLFLAN